MSVIAWTCKLCGHHVEGLSVDEYMSLDKAHVCLPADQIRRAAAYFRRRSRPGSAMGAVTEWLEHCAQMAAKADSPRRQKEIADPHALAVARATPWEEES